MAATCPHGCPHCKLIEAGHDPRQGLTPRQFMDLFEVIEPERERAPLADDTLKAIEDEELARLAREASEHDLRELRSMKEKDRRHPNFDDALRAATDERKEAGERHHAARIRVRGLVARDQALWWAERRAAEEAERRAAQEAERAAMRKRGRSLLERLRS